MPIDKQGLSLEQWKAAELLALGKKMRPKEIAKECGVKVSTVRKWMGDPKFKLAVLKKFEDNMSELRSQRLGAIKGWLDKLYSKIDEELEEIEDSYTLKELINMITKLHNEIRTDNVQFTKSRKLLEMLAEYTGRDPDAIDTEEEGLESVEERYLRRRQKEQEEAESKVREIGSAKRKKKSVSK